MSKKFEILCVDDEPEVLQGLRLHLKRHYEVHTVGGGAEGLELLRDNRNIAVILSDMRMPGMDGAQFLNAARSAAPEAVRMLLTGYADIESAMAAVNEGQVFRFISKPCPPDQLLGAFQAAVGQHELIAAERVLLQNTLLGCVESLAKVLSLTKPAAFGRALRLRSKVRAVLAHLELHKQWQIEAAAVLSQLGAVTLTDETLIKLNDGEPLDEADRLEVCTSIQISVQMLENIARLEPVREILSYLALEIAGALPQRASAAPPGALLLRLVSEWDRLEARGLSQAEVFAQIASADGPYDRDMLELLRNMPAIADAPSSSRVTSVRSLLPGMVLAQDLVRANGVVILPRGFEIDKGLLEHVLTFADEFKDETVKVFAR